jgi:ABC-type Zn2+ transport system substrate-binding protein/surface adhesin
MKRSLRLLVCILAFFAFACASETAAKPIRIVAGTEMIADIARDLTGGNAEIISLVPAASCPGHHDVRAADIAFIKTADAVILHPGRKSKNILRMPLQRLALRQRPNTWADAFMACSRELNGGKRRGLRSIEQSTGR